MMIDRSHPSGLPADPADDLKPTFTREELSLLDAEADAIAIDSELDEEERRGDENMRKLGLSDAEIARIRGRAAPTPKPTLADVERELDEHFALRKSDKRKFYSEAEQKRREELIALQGKLKAQDRSEAAPEEDGNAGALGEGGLPEPLRQEWEKSGPGGIEDALRAIRKRTTMLDELEDGGEGLRSGF